MANSTTRPVRRRYARLGEDILTTGMIAEACRVAPRTVSKWCDSGSLRCYRIGPDGAGDRRIRRADFVAFAQRRGMPVSVGCPGHVCSVLLYGYADDLLARAQSALPDKESVRIFFASNPLGAGVVIGRECPGLVVVEPQAEGASGVAAECRDRGLPVRRIRRPPAGDREIAAAVAQEIADAVSDWQSRGEVQG